MRVLVACEESQEICKAFRERGHEAYSCDLQECSGGHPEWHIQADVFKYLNPGYYKYSTPARAGVTTKYGIDEFKTCDGIIHQIGKWDLIIAHPPCTDLCVSGARWFKQKREDGRQKKSIEFFMRFINANCKCIAVENQIGIMSTYYRKPDQIIQPWQYGDHARKSTCLWLKGLPKLEPTNIVDPGEIKTGGYSVGASADYARDENGRIIAWNDPRTAKLRSKTFSGIAKAMAEQWGGAV